MNALPTSRRSAFLRRTLIDLAIMTVIGVGLALIGPFGSFGDPLALRLVVWLGFAYIGYAVYSPIDGLAKRLAPGLALPAWGLQVAGVMAASVPMTLAVWVLPRLPDRVRIPDLSTAVSQYLYVLIVGGLITLLFAVMKRDDELPPATVTSDTVGAKPAILPEQQAITPRFLDRLPPELGGELIALEMEDHYVRAHTALGNELVLLRMRDAVAELDGMDGEQVHRSWWVARGAVADVKREGRNVRLVLDNGVEAPVSRANVTPLKEAGWI
ncbi:LytTR family DNA-binding domain-containing protein [Aurantiacibacter marinus]|uniref:HTH LytTR-type domain-containing protein n=1 Tax=Aurantiacibacter marinus TaxID=874156 RepID=A0A0H0XR21_9SPHN|nr:LytTR family DNA-binding domain-containing protein [Aurantiacibacter marinus]KLI64441.1 hypothetical protein AAV99_02240 [Aurantiacibacter marinus]